MPKKKNSIDESESLSGSPAEDTEIAVVPLEETPEEPSKAQEASEGESKPSKPKKPRVSVPKKEFIMILDGGRSQIKVLVIVNGEVSSTLVLESTICQVEAPPFGEQGAFSMSREKIEVDAKQRDLVEHWVVGTSAKLQGKEYISMSDGEDHKVTYFPILALGAIASLPNLYELSTGSNDKSRSLSIKLITLSLANPLALKESIKRCKWMRVGVKVAKLSPAATQCLKSLSRRHFRKKSG